MHERREEKASKKDKREGPEMIERDERKKVWRIEHNGGGKKKKKLRRKKEHENN